MFSYRLFPIDHKKTTMGFKTLNETSIESDLAGVKSKPD